MDNQKTVGQSESLPSPQPTRTDTAGSDSSRSLGSASLSPTMSECVKRIRAHCGTITRYPGGFWCIENAAGETISPTYGTSTVEALVKRGVLEYSEWKQSHGRQFPIKARMTPNGEK